MNKYKLPSLNFIVVIVVAAFIAFMSGYNFDQRNPDVGFAVGVALFIAIGLSLFVYSHQDL
jgi:multisubunit Na+/H+ antiporter MnhB subunit